MLLLGSRLAATPVMSLQTGTRLAHTTTPIIDPSNLKIVAYELEGPLLTERPSFVRTQDIREYGRLGMIIDSDDELIGLEDVIQVQKLYDLGFPLIGMAVIDDRKHKLGKVSDYTLETDGFVVQQLNIQRGIFKAINDTGLLIHRSQIIEINDSAIVVRSAAIKSVEPVMQSVRNEFVNPFRKPQQTDAEAMQSSD
jgi:uncharacterized protein YrrD